MIPNREPDIILVINSIFGNKEAVSYWVPEQIRQFDDGEVESINMLELEAACREQLLSLDKQSLYKNGAQQFLKKLEDYRIEQILLNEGEIE